MQEIMSDKSPTSRLPQHRPGMALMTEKALPPPSPSSMAIRSSVSFPSATWSRKRSGAQRFIIQELERYIAG